MSPSQISGLQWNNMGHRGNGINLYCDITGGMTLMAINMQADINIPTGGLSVLVHQQ